jgi:hypothetical protein
MPNKRFYGVDCKGELLVQRVASKPAWKSGDQGRIVCDLALDKFWFGGASAWLDFSLASHLHDARYSLLSHLHDDRYALLGHDHGSQFPTGTVMLFGQSSAPVGWTKVMNRANDSMLMFTTGNIASGASDSPHS